jgi:hypothetical protein
VGTPPSEITAEAKLGVLDALLELERVLVELSLG